MFNSREGYRTLEDYVEHMGDAISSEFRKLAAVARGDVAIEIAELREEHEKLVKAIYKALGVDQDAAIRREGLVEIFDMVSYSNPTPVHAPPATTEASGIQEENQQPTQQHY